MKGVGFTVAIFISLLAFQDQGVREEAKLAILIASVIAGTIGGLALVVRHLVVNGNSDKAADT